MKLPNVDQAIVTERKVTDYLLSPTHHTGQHKAAFFSRFGFSRSAWQTLADALRSHASQHDVVEMETTYFGTSYTVEGGLEAPDGRSPLVRVVWFIETGETAPKLVTAYPLAGGRK